MTLPPGPRLPAAVQTLRLIARPIPFFERARREFGETFTVRMLRAGPLVFISDPDSIKALFAADRVNTLTGSRNLVLAPLLGERSLLLLEGAEHLARRRLMLPAFHGERMLAYADAMEEATEREIAGWRAGSEVNLHAAMQSITLDVIMRAVFGVAEDRRERLRRSLVEMLAATRSPLSIGITLPAVSRLPRFRRVADMIADANRLLAAEVAAHRADPRLQEREDILSMLLLARDEDGDGMDDAEIRDQLMTLLVAGHETTATGLAWTFDLLFRNPGALARARAEAAGDDHAYLDAVVEEALRLRPVIPFVGRELRVASELGGYELPVGTNVMPSIYLTHTRADLFPEPYAFRPERFGEAKPETYSWIPFGGGTRRCLGAAFAQMEMRVVLRTVLRQVELEPARDEPERFVRRNVTLSPAHGTPARVVARWPGERGGRALAAGPR